MGNFMGVLTKFRHWFKVKHPSRPREVRRLEEQMEAPQGEPQRGAALAFFMEKYAPEATKHSFEIVARAELRRHGCENVDLDNLSPEQEKLLLQVFARVSKYSMGEWIAGICMSEYHEREIAELRKAVEAAKARREREQKGG